MAKVELLSSAAFVRNFIPPDYLIEGLILRKFFYSLTGKTGSGKTAIALLFAALVALHRTMDGREFAPGRVLYLAGENSVDVQMRWIAMSEQLGFDVDTIDVYFIPGVFTVSEMQSFIAEKVEALGGVVLVVIDTSAAYFEGDDENNNIQAGKYARMQRKLVELPGGPTVLALCHPIKNAPADNLIPRGGGSYLNETDGNLTLQNNSGVVELHWQGKHRGPDFAPISFQLSTVTHERLKDTKGRTIPTVVASHLNEVKHNELKTTARTQEDQLLAVIASNPAASRVDLARLVGWNTGDGEPYKVMVGRVVKRLKNQKLIDDGRDGLELTKTGKEALKAAQGVQEALKATQAKKQVLKAAQGRKAEAAGSVVGSDENREARRPRVGSDLEMISVEPPGTMCVHCREGRWERIPDPRSSAWRRKPTPARGVRIGLLR